MDEAKAANGTPNGEQRALLALALGVLAPLAYMIQRAFEVSISAGATPNPALVLRSTHASFYWRAIIGAWWAGVLALACWRWARTQPSSTLALGLGRLALACGLLLPLAAWLLP